MLMKKLLLLYILTIVPLIMPLNTQAMYVINSPISNINVSGHSSLITINDTPWTHFINSDFFVYLLNNKIKILIVSAAGIFLIKRIFFSTPKSPTKKQKYSPTQKSFINTQTNTSQENNSVTINCVDMSNNKGIVWNSGEINVGNSNSIIATNESTIIISDNPSSNFIGYIKNVISNLFLTNQNTIYDAGEMETKEITLSGIDSIDGWGPGTVIITYDPEGEEKLTIRADKNILAILQGFQSGSMLHFGPKNNVYFETNSGITYVALVKTLNTIFLGGSLKTYTNTINADNLIITIDGSAILESEIETNDLSIGCDGSSLPRLKGKALHQKIKLDGYSQLDVSELISNSAEITMDGNAQAWIALQKATNNNLHLRMNGSTQLNGTIDIASLQLKMDGYSKATLRGNALHQNITKLDGFSQLKASELMGNSANIRMDGGAEAWLSVQKTISYDIDGSSQIVYYGNPTIQGNRDGLAKIRAARLGE